MKVTSYALGRPMYYDRNATTTNGGYFDLVGPHLGTTRWTITNTASQKMFVDSGSIAMARVTAATTVGTAFAAIQSPSGQPIILIFLQSATAGTTHNVAMGGSVYVAPGGQLLGVTQDLSVGGTIQYSLFAHVVQYDV